MFGSFAADGFAPNDARQDDSEIVNVAGPDLFVAFGGAMDESPEKIIVRRLVDLLRHLGRLAFSRTWTWRFRVWTEILGPNG